MKLWRYIKYIILSAAAFSLGMLLGFFVKITYEINVFKAYSWESKPKIVMAKILVKNNYIEELNTGKILESIFLL